MSINSVVSPAVVDIHAARRLVFIERNLRYRSGEILDMVEMHAEQVRCALRALANITEGADDEEIGASARDLAALNHIMGEYLDKCLNRDVTEAMISPAGNFDAEAANFFADIYFRPNAHSLTDCYMATADKARQMGWTIPSFEFLRKNLKELERELS